MKRCVRKGHIKSKEEFSKSKKNKDGLQSWCKECNKEYQKKMHNIKNNNWKLYRLVINLKGIKPNLKIGDPKKLKCEKMHYIGITQKPLKDRLNEHISAIRNKKTDKAYFWINKFFIDEDIDVTTINLRKYITIELIEEYHSETPIEIMKKYEKKAVWNEGRISYQEGKNRFGRTIPLFDVINIEHFPGSKNCKDMLIKHDIIKHTDSKKHSEFGDQSV